MSMISFEIFPPKEDGDEAVLKTQEVLNRLDALSPAFISVTYGAGGSNSKKTLDLIRYIKQNLKVSPLAHITCVGYQKSDLKKVLEELTEIGCSKILALRGDRPKWMTDEQFEGMDFAHAKDMIQYVRKEEAAGAFPSFDIAAACYPEGHPESESPEKDLAHLKEKVEEGASMLITQMFFDNDIFYRFREKAEKTGIHAPLHAGIMPITSAKQLGTSVSLSGSSIPKALSDLIAKFGDKPEDMRKAGIDFAVRQILDLMEHGTEGTHIYTMNRSKSMEELMHELFPGH